MIIKKSRIELLFVSFFALFFLLSLSTFASVFGDSNLDGKVDIVDVQCSTSLALIKAQYPECKLDKNTPEPDYCALECLKTDVGSMDYQCDGDLNVVDTQAITLLASKQGEILKDKTPGCQAQTVCTNKVWTKKDLPVGNEEGVYYDFSDIWGINGGHIFAVGSEVNAKLYGTNSITAIFEYKDNKWTKVALPVVVGSLTSIWGDSSKGEAFAAGTAGVIFHYKNGVWGQIESPTTKSISDIYAFTFDNVYAMAEDSLLHFDGNIWTIYKTWVFKENLPFKIFGTKDGVLLGLRGNIKNVLELKNNEWELATEQSSLNNYPTAFWADSKDNIVLLQTYYPLTTELKNIIIHFDGQKWSTANISADSGIDSEITMGKTYLVYLESIAGQTADNLYAVGHIYDFQSEFNEYTLVLNFNGVEWKQAYFDKSPVLPTSLTDLWVGENGDVAIVGSGNSALHYTCQEGNRGKKRGR